MAELGFIQNLNHPFVLFTVFGSGKPSYLFPQGSWREKNRLPLSYSDLSPHSLFGAASSADSSSVKHVSNRQLDLKCTSGFESMFINKQRPPKIFECPRCGQKFGHPRSIHRHLKACEGKFDFKCGDCDRCFHRLDSLKHHALTKHRINLG